jgi:hypothetical protein
MTTIDFYELRREKVGGIRASAVQKKPKNTTSPGARDLLPQT